MIMKTSIAIVMLGLFTLQLSAQNITNKEWAELSEMYDNEEWEKTGGLALTLLNKTEDKESDQYAKILYMYIFSVAGQVIDEKMSIDEAEQTLNQYIGQNIITPPRPVTDQSMGANTLILNKEFPIAGFSVTQGSNPAYIHSYEQFTFSYPVKYSEYKDMSVACGGKLSSVKVNRKENERWVFDLQFNECFVIRQ